MLKHIVITLLITTLSLFVLIENVKSCNEAVCGSVVSKCLLTKACNCDLKNCTCCKECINCLSSLYSECCSCVDICPKPNETETDLSKKSHVEEFDEGVPQLFSVLTESPDSLKRWDTKTFPVDMEFNYYDPKKQIKITMLSVEQEVDSEKLNAITVNCTVVFWGQCMSWKKCKTSCQSMGASSYRWFHDGCCECVGQYCIKYGINESRCSQCPQIDEKLINEEDDDYFDYEDHDDEYEDD
ncbi:protein twisted gastrulation-like [Diorhabda carinulata]|uniref:protein twisted gastrulation-like n=1 Tax=Diorhabda carinulata TaxID=1163345 RepID=UPI0025A19333|nr:protein twisted gastrulation-like [Diorhabda carinulata]XP_057664961.1 protein twisted gastrulation-like [Diorhabda carinulata]